MAYFKKALDSYKAIYRTLPRIVGVEMKRYSDEAFRKQAWEGKSWARRKPRGNVVNRRSRQRNTSVARGRTSFQYNKWVLQDANRSLLIKTGRLKRARRVRTFPDRVQMVTDIPYAKVHNEGGKVGRKKGGTMPARQHMGFTKESEERVKKWLGENLKGMFK